MEGEISNFIKVWLLALTSLCYSYLIGKATHKGLLRLALLSPVIVLFLFLPLALRSAHLGGLTAFFLAWLANFKLFLFSFEKGPLKNPSSISLPLFLAISCLPIDIATKTRPREKEKRAPVKNYAAKALFLGLLLKVYDFSELFNPKALLCLYLIHIYLFLELTLVGLASAARAISGLELEAQFDEPYLSSSLQDFWGRRWNLAVSRVLRPTVYEPTLELFSVRLGLGRRWAPLPAVLTTFAVSALMHELMLFYMGPRSAWPDWEVGRFFALHGLCLCVEIGTKRLRIVQRIFPRLVSGILTFGFVMWTALWLFVPPFLRVEADVKMLRELSALGSFFRDLTRSSNFL